MQKDLVFTRKISALPWLPFAASMAGAFVYVLHAFYLARTKTSFLDEGLYLYKGYLFATGQQTPFADYGLWTNHAILRSEEHTSELQSPCNLVWSPCNLVCRLLLAKK